MKLQNIEISSILSPEARYVTITSKFLPNLADEVPVFTSYSGEKVKLRELIILSERTGKKIITGYKYDLEVKEGDGGLTSLYDVDQVILTMKAKKYNEFMTTTLIFIGLKKGSPEKALILHDVPVLAKNKTDLIDQIKGHLRTFHGIEIDHIPAKFKVEHKHLVKAKLTDVDYAFSLFNL
ncbi:hypothetical protein [Stygiolobus sp. CP8521M]|jgi:hypothetical protein|uniref:hypothetical protein n=1 Tax=Stygiolobus sp. CP8521M TaxID=3133136 RepID=UPI00307D109C